MPDVDEEQIARLFDEDRDPEELVREDDWHAAPEMAHLYLYDTVAQRRRWYLNLAAMGRV